MPFVRLRRSDDDRVVAGVCAGIAQAIGVDPTLVRLVFTLLALAGGAGIALYGAVWLYMSGKGWLAVVAFVPLLHAIGWAGMAWLLAGGVLYTTGVFFYLVDEKYAHSHGVFHLFVLGGSVLHFLVVLRFLA